jgi:hypothetical protein
MIHQIYMDCDFFVKEKMSISKMVRGAVAQTISARKKVTGSSSELQRFRQMPFTVRILRWPVGVWKVGRPKPGPVLREECMDCIDAILW